MNFFLWNDTMKIITKTFHGTKCGNNKYMGYGYYR